MMLIKYVTFEVERRAEVADVFGHILLTHLT